ncbi:MAG TPA: glycogen/starch/alpha-glucan phosphorylase, partial [Stellaceae bacterium]
SGSDRERFAPLTSRLRQENPYLVAADFAAYSIAQQDIEKLWRCPTQWAQAAIHNIAGMSWFSSDRTIAGYARDIWGIPF